jgi:uncharacterized RDD family membrane protein YckC
VVYEKKYIVLKTLTMETVEQNPPYDENLLDDVSVDLVQASSGTRFANLLIDRLILYALWRFILGPLAVNMIISMGLYTYDRVGLWVELYLFAVVFDVMIIAIQEATMGGKTFGKLITRTRAVNENGTPIDFRKALMRSLSRAVPFEAFSALGAPCYPWHDRWTGTLVIDEKTSRMPA